MKKIFTILAAAVAAFSLASCNKEIAEEIPAVTSDFMVDITVPSLSGAETKAVKSSWEKGDKLNIWFDGAYWNVLPQLVLTYDGTKWNASEMDKSILRETGTFNVIYEASNSEFTEVRNNSYYYFPYKDVITSGTSAKRQYAVPMSCYQNGVEYTYSEGKLTANISSWQFLTMIQVVVTGLTKSASSYALKIDGVQNTAAYAFNAATGTFTNSGNSTGGYSIGVQNKDGIAFYFGGNSKPESRDLVFTLKERLSEKEIIFTKTSTALVTSATSVKAVKIGSEQFKIASDYNGYEYVDLGLSVKWATMNVGASKPEDRGDYFAWAETTIKSDYSESTYKWKVEGMNFNEYITKYTVADGKKDGIWYDGDTFVGDNKTSFADYNYVDDVARQNWKGTWRTPTSDEFAELVNPDNCDWAWTSSYKGTDVPGYIVTSKITGHIGNSIFLPTTGYKYSTNDTRGLNTFGEYWSSSLTNDDSWAVYGLVFNSEYTKVRSSMRFYGEPIRPVSD